MKKTRRNVIVIIFLVLIIIIFLIIAILPSKFEKNDIREVFESDITAASDDYYPYSVNILFAVDTNLISSDCNTANTITDAIDEIFSKVTQANINTQICVFSDASNNETTAVFSEKIENRDDIFVNVESIRTYFGKSTDTETSGDVLTSLAEISHLSTYSDSNFVFVFTNDRLRDIPLSDAQKNDIGNLHISYVIPSDCKAQKKSDFEKSAEVFGGKVFSEYIRQEKGNNISDVVPSDISQYVKDMVSEDKMQESGGVSEKSTQKHFLSEKQTYDCGNGRTLHFEMIKTVDSDSDGMPDTADPFPDKENVFYDRNKVRRYAGYAYSKLENGQFRYLGLRGDSATNCANFVSQCIYMGGYDMTDDWFMRKYSDSESKIKKYIDKIVTYSGSFICQTFGDVTKQKYTDMAYMWTYPWSSASVQEVYGQKTFFTECITADSCEEIKRLAKEKGVQAGDVIYQGEDRHHVLMITNVADDGTLFLSAHNPPKYEERLDENYWKKGGFNQVAVYKVSDVID